MPGTGTTMLTVAHALSDGRCYAIRDIALRSSLPEARTGGACARLIRRGWVERRELGCYRLTAEGAAALARGDIIRSGDFKPRTERLPRRPLRETARDRVWRAIRVLQKFSCAEIENLAEASHANVLGYVRALQEAGYLSMTSGPRAGRRFLADTARWLLVDDPGPKTLVPRRSGKLYDPNRGQERTITPRPKQ